MSTRVSMLKIDDAYGMSCFNCDETISGGDMDDVGRKAADAKWMIGLMASGQAYYGCPNCGPCLYGARTLKPYEYKSL